MSKIGSLDPEIWAKKWSKSGQIEVPERFFEKIEKYRKNANEHCCRELGCAYLKIKIIKIGLVVPELWSK